MQELSLAFNFRVNKVFKLNKICGLNEGSNVSLRSCEYFKIGDELQLLELKLSFWNSFVFQIVRSWGNRTWSYVSYAKKLKIVWTLKIFVFLYRKIHFVLNINSIILLFSVHLNYFLIC